MIRICSLLVFAALLPVIPNGGQAAAIPEPSLVLYGSVINTNGPFRQRVTYGTLTWTFQASGGGAPIVISTPLHNINDQFSYALTIPCESEATGLMVSPNTVLLSVAPRVFTRTQVTVSAEDTNQFAAVLVPPAPPSMSVSLADRGRLERVDLMVSVPMIDVDGDGLPDAWERQYLRGLGFGPNDDPDGDGLSNLAELQAGTDPTDAGSLFQFIQIQPAVPSGLLLKWSSVAERSYTLERSLTIASGFAPVQSNVAATPPINQWVDVSATGAGPYFYRIKLVQP
jgi:hypothetical protein